MTRFLLDTGIASDFINDRLGVRERARTAVQGGHRIGIPTVVLGELWGGIELSATAQQNRDRLRHHLHRFVIWPFDADAAVHYGRLYAELRRIGRPMQQIDIQIAAIAFSLGNSTVVTKDSDLSAVPGLGVVDGSKD